MNKLNDIGFRGVVMMLFIIISLALTYYIYQNVKKEASSEFVAERVIKSLEKTFSDPWVDAKYLGSKNAVEWSVVRMLHRKYNIENNNVYLVSIGRSYMRDIPEDLVGKKQYHIILQLADYEIDASVIALLPDNKYSYAIFASIVLVSGVLLLFMFPSYSPIDQYRLAKLYGVIFDRKVSSKKAWGSWQLTHLGTGSRLINIHPNSYEQVNDDQAVNTCIDGISMAMEAVETTFSRDIEYLNDWPTHKSKLRKILTKIKSRINERPDLMGEEDVGAWIIYVRHVVLSSVMINVAETDTYTQILGLESQKIESCPPSAWLIDGYNIFMPMKIWKRLLRALNQGVRSAYDTQISRVKVYTHEDMPFIFIDFEINDRNLDRDNINRLKDYISQPFDGDLDYLVNGISNFGRLQILDQRKVVDLTDRRIYRKGVVKTLTVRFMMRRIDKDEKIQLVEKMDVELMPLLNETIKHDA